MLDPRAASLAGAIALAGMCLIVGLANLVMPDYGVAFLAVMDSIYFGLVPGGTAASVVAMTVLSAIDGAVLGFLVVWLYDRLARIPTDEQ